MKSNQPVDWEEIQLGELFTAHYGKSLTQKNRVPGKYKVYGSSGITGTHNEFLVKGPGLIIGRKGTIGNVYYEKNSFYPIDTTYYVKESNRYDLLFLYYKLKTLDLDKMNTHSAVPGLNREQLYSIKTKFPKITEQKAIANILSTLDEKIETNNQINEKLEEMAQALFKHWFVDFEFPNENGKPYKSSGGEMVESELGMIPKGWEVKTINDISSEIITGKTPSTKEKENFGGNIPFVKIPDMHGKVYVEKTETYLSEKGAVKNKIVPKNSIMVSCIATPGIVSLAGQSCQTNQQINTIINKDNKMCYFNFFSLRNLSDTIRTLGSSGSATLNLNKNQFSKIKIVVPPKEMTDKYFNVVDKIFETIYLNQKENLKLIELRDTLLPKLMSGEIRVPLDNETFVEQS
ncbi:restriction endonuclease subunit S [Caldifermentibacillus hisashii]|uniref:restriction endonuclease subunit S n=1 Tax=Caldifermentibacillus hisashii TaxID=996558 RepID=UPI002E20B9D7|nr:restriction endonuclease subunit S [Caldifermentibacillus hisashii]MED3644637.1 restriction endonuclease subunit S [Caldifermentibacillus hisashii]